MTSLKIIAVRQKKVAAQKQINSAKLNKAKFLYKNYFNHLKILADKVLNNKLSIIQAQKVQFKLVSNFLSALAPADLDFSILLRGSFSFGTQCLDADVDLSYLFEDEPSKTYQDYINMLVQFDKLGFIACSDIISEHINLTRMIADNKASVKDIKIMVENSIKGQYEIPSSIKNRLSFAEKEYTRFLTPPLDTGNFWFGKIINKPFTNSQSSAILIKGNKKTFQKFINELAKIYAINFNKIQQAPGYKNHIQSIIQELEKAEPDFIEPKDLYTDIKNKYKFHILYTMLEIFKRKYGIKNNKVLEVIAQIPKEALAINTKKELIDCIQILQKYRYLMTAFYIKNDKQDTPNLIEKKIALTEAEKEQLTKLMNAKSFPELISKIDATLKRFKRILIGMAEREGFDLRGLSVQPVSLSKT